MERKQIFVSVIAVVRNDAVILKSYVEEVIKTLAACYEDYEIVLVDDASTDGSSDIIGSLLATHECIRCLRLSRSFGIEPAISAGLDNVIGEIVIVMDLSTDPPALLPKIIDRTKALDGVVFGILSNRGEIFSRLHNFLSSVYYLFCRVCLTHAPPRNTSYFLGMTRKTLNAVLKVKNSSQHPFVRLFGPQVGFRTDTFTYRGIVRSSRKKLELSEAIHAGILSLKTNSTVPLRLVAHSNLFLSVAAVVFCITLFFGGAVELVALVGSSVFFLFAFELSVFAEYIITLVESSRRHPHYFIATESNSSVMIANETNRKNVMTEQE